MYSTQDRVWWVERYNAGRSFRDVCDEFAALNPTKPRPSHTTVRLCVRRFRATGNVNEVKKGRQLPPRETGNELLVLAAVANDPHVSTRAIAAEGGPSHSAVWKILHRNKFRSYHAAKHQELRPGDRERRFEFASLALEMKEADPAFFRKIIFTDESSFTKHHTPNTQNFRTWSQDNPRACYPANTQYPEKVNVWAGIVDHQILGPIFIDGTLTGAKYRDLLQNEVSALMEDLNHPDELWYHHDGCPAHNFRLAREYLHDCFPGRVIGSYEQPLAWPARSPDLNPCDSFLWGHCKSKIYGGNPFPTVDALKEAIMECMAAITPVQLAAVTRDFEDRLGYCVAAEGDIFEHLL